MEEYCPLTSSKWIGGDAACESPVIIRRFDVKKAKRAVLLVTGLGYFEAKINHQSVSDARFIPVVSDYAPRKLEQFLYPLHDETTHGIYYYKYDVTSLLGEGENILTIQLGNGFYRQTERIAEGRVDFGEVLKAIYCLEIETESGICTICSDGSETWQESEIVYTNLFIGEVIDPSAVGPEKSVQILPAPEAELRAEMGTVDKVIRRITPKVLGKVEGRTIFDAGENISGIVRIHTSAARGEKIRLRFAEKIHADLSLDFSSVGEDYTCLSGRKQIMEDVFISDGTPRDFEPKFVWHAFRYFDAEGDFDRAEVLVIHSDVPVTASFESPSEGLEFLLDAYLRTQLGNMHGSIPSDCPHRERLGYTGDGQICAPAAMMLLDSQEFYRKWIQDIWDCQDKKTGHVQHTAPLMGGGGGPGGWGCAIVIVPYVYYKQFGDAEILKNGYEPMRRWIEYLKTHSENGLVVREEEGGWCLGEWFTLDEVKIPEPYVNTCYMLKSLCMMQEIAAVTGNEKDIPEYQALSESISDAMKKTYYNVAAGHYCDGVQGADAYAVWSGLAEGQEAERLAAELAAKYDAMNHFDTGFLGTDILLEVLMDHGYADVVLKLLESEEAGSFLYMKRHGATTLWESWEGDYSHYHPMFGACVRQLFTGFLGIRQKPGTAGYKEVEISPRISKNLAYAKGSILTPQGEIAVAWEKTEDGIALHVTAPESVTIRT